jgi:hypothetical protein
MDFVRLQVLNIPGEDELTLQWQKPQKISKPTRFRLSAAGLHGSPLLTARYDWFADTKICLLIHRRHSRVIELIERLEDRSLEG